MQQEITEGIEISNTTRKDLPDILWLFEEAMRLQGKDGYIVWNKIDKTGLENDIDNNLQFKMIKGNEVLCIFSVQYSDPFIWRDLDQNNAIYLHRIVVNPRFRGKKLFEKVLNWSVNLVRQKKLKYIRMDTWADNAKIIDYYKSFGFRFIENYRTSNTPELPIQNRNLHVALLEKGITYT